MRNFLTALAGTGALLAAGTALAADPATGTIAVSATVLKNCTTSATNLAFGSYTPTGGPANANATVTVNCTKGTTFTVALNKGTTTGGTVAQRLMADTTGDTLQYNIYTTSSFATVWGDGTGTSVTQAGTGAGMGTAVTFTAYGNLPDNATNQAAPPATTYADTVTVSVTY